MVRNRCRPISGTKEYAILVFLVVAVIGLFGFGVQFLLEPVAPAVNTADTTEGVAAQVNDVQIG